MGSSACCSSASHLIHSPQTSPTAIPGAKESADSSTIKAKEPRFSGLRANWRLLSYSLSEGSFDRLTDSLQHHLHPVHLRICILEFLPLRVMLQVYGQGRDGLSGIFHVRGDDYFFGDIRLNWTAAQCPSVSHLVRLLYGYFSSDITRHPFLVWKSICFHHGDCKTTLTKAQPPDEVIEVLRFVPRRNVIGVGLSGAWKSGIGVHELGLPSSVERIQIGESSHLGALCLGWEPRLEYASEVLKISDQHLRVLLDQHLRVLLFGLDGSGSEMRARALRLRKVSLCSPCEIGDEDVLDLLKGVRELDLCLVETETVKRILSARSSLCDDESEGRSGEVGIRTLTFSNPGSKQGYPADLLLDRSLDRFLLEEITTLNIHRMSGLSDTILCRIFIRMRRLRTLDVSNCEGLTWRSLLLVIESTNISDLDFSGIETEFDGSYVLEGENKSLRRLCVGQTLRTEPVFRLLASCQSLTKLTFGYPNMNLRSIDSSIPPAPLDLLAEIPSLAELHIDISSWNDLHSLRENCKIVLLEVRIGGDEWNSAVLKFLPQQIRYLSLRKPSPSEFKLPIQADDVAIVEGLKRLTALSSLTVGNLPVSDTFSTTVHTCCPWIRELAIRTWYDMYEV